MARLVLGGKYGRDIVFVGNTRFLPAHVAKVVRDHFSRWNTLTDITSFPRLLQELGDARAQRHFPDTDWEALDAFYRSHMQRYSLVFKGEVASDSAISFAVGCPHGTPAKSLQTVMQAWCEPSGKLRDNFDLWRVDKLLRRAKAQIKYAPTFTDALKVFGATAISLEESLSFFRQIQAYHARQFLQPGLTAILAQYIDKVDTLRDPLELDEVVAKLQEAGANVRVDRTVSAVLEHSEKLQRETAELVGTTLNGARGTASQNLEREAPASQQGAKEHKGFHNRGYLAHFDAPDAIQFITFRLYDSLPQHRIAQLRKVGTPDLAKVMEVEDWLDEEYGPCYLHNEKVAEVVKETLEHFDRERYDLFAWVIMGNHVHAMLREREGFPLGKVIRNWKTWSAKQSNLVLGRSGEFWQRDYFDRMARDFGDIKQFFDYIIFNPVKAGLCKQPSEYKWSSCYGISPEDAEARLGDRLRECFEDARQGLALHKSEAEPRVPEDAQQELRAPGLTDRSLPKTSSPLDDLITSSHLYPFQREGVAFLVTNKRALLADDMGLGKTIQAIAAAVYLKHKQGLKRALVICPASLKYQWQAEIRRFTRERVEVIGGEPAERDAIYRAAAHDGGFIAPEDKPFFYIVNYELVHRDLEKLKALGAELLIVDEAQRVKNFRTKTAQAVFELPAPYVFVLTGTPLENQLMELFTIMRFIDERALGRNPIAFRERYVILDNFGGVMGYQRVEEVARKIASVTLRRTKEQTLTDLPEMVEVPRWLDLTPTQRTIYQELQGQARQMLMQSVWDGVQSNNALTVLQRLRETCDSAELIDPERKDSQKVEELLALLDDEVRTLGRQALVFTQWTRMGEILMRELTAAGFKPAFLHGGIPSTQRPALVERFQEGRDRILISTDAGGTGLNLQAASLVVNYDLPFNPAKLSQRVARAHRLGQTGTVIVVNLLSRGTVEEKLVRILSEKRELFQDVFGDISDLSQASGQQLNIRELLRELV